MASLRSVVSIVVKASAKQATSALARFFGFLRKTSTAIATLFGGLTLTGITTALFKAGTEAEETASKFETVFGDAAKSLEPFLQGFARIAGLTDQAGQDLLAFAGSIAQGLGIAQEASAAFSEEIIRLAADLASFNNTNIEWTTSAVVKALTGEREELAKYGIKITEVDVQKRALLQTGKEVEAALTQEEKAWATLSIMYERAGVAVGDVLRTQESLANQFRKVRAIALQLRDDIAVALAPSFAVLVSEADRLVGGMQDWGDKVKEQGPIIAAWVRFTIRALGTITDAIQLAFRVVYQAFVSLDVLGQKLFLTWDLLSIKFANAFKPRRFQVDTSEIEAKLQSLTDQVNIGNQKIKDGASELQDEFNLMLDSWNMLTVAQQEGAREMTEAEKAAEAARKAMQEAAKEAERLNNALLEASGAAQKLKALRDAEDALREMAPSAREIASLQSAITREAEKAAAARSLAAEQSQIVADLDRQRAAAAAAGAQAEVTRLDALLRGAMAERDRQSAVANAAEVEEQRLSVLLARREALREETALTESSAFNLQAIRNLEYQIAELEARRSELNVEQQGILAGLKLTLLEIRNIYAEIGEQITENNALLERAPKVEPFEPPEYGEQVPGEDLPIIEPPEVSRLTKDRENPFAEDQDAFSFGQMLTEVSELMTQFESLEDLVRGGLATAFRAFGDAVKNSFAAAVTGAQSFGQAFKQTMLSALSQIAGAFGEFYMAKATAAIGEGLLGNPGAFAAAAKFTAAALAFFAISGAASGGAFGGTGGTFGGLTAAEYETSDRVQNSRGDATLIIEGGLLDMSNPEQADAFARALEELSGRRVSVVGG